MFEGFRRVHIVPLNAFKGMKAQIGMQKGRQAVRQTHSLTDTQTHRHTDTQTVRQTGRQIDTQTD